MNSRNTNAGIQAAIAKGWRPNAYLTNMSMAFFQDPGDFVATSIFPICPVQLSASYFYTFSKADLARDNVQRKPAYGKVQPAIMGQEDNNYKCEVDQVLVGIDQIAQLNYQRSHAPGVADPRRAKVRFASEQMLLHQDIVFASKFFKAGVWANQLEGTTTGSGSGEFMKFTESAFDPVAFEAGKPLEYCLPENVCVLGDGEKLRRLVSILLDNAIKYGAPGGAVTLTLERRERQAVLTVSNPGEIPEEELPRLFQRFYRADASRGEQSGFGLGLSIADAIAREHRGVLRAESGGGLTRFVFLLPLKR